MKILTLIFMASNPLFRRLVTECVSWPKIANLIQLVRTLMTWTELGVVWTLSVWNSNFIDCLCLNFNIKSKAFSMFVRMEEWRFLVTLKFLCETGHHVVGQPVVIHPCYFPPSSSKNSAMINVSPHWNKVRKDS